MDDSASHHRLLLIHPLETSVLPGPLTATAGTQVEVRYLPAEEGSWLLRAENAIRAAQRRPYGAIVALLPGISHDHPADTVRLLRAGADDVLAATEPDVIELLGHTISRLNTLLDDCARLEADCGLIGSSVAMQQTRKALAAAAHDPTINTLLLGETGTGKCLAARALHRLDETRREQPFHAFDCGAVTETLFGSELFGHVSGAFTGAHSSRSGALSSAGRGTLLLDEIGELSASLQASFLSALQERQYRPVGSDRDQPMQCRIVAATNKDLPALVRRGSFRADLFYRLDGVRVTVPPLRARREDIAQLFNALLARCRARATPPQAEVDGDVLAFLSLCPLRGNVRELESIARHCATAAGSEARVRLPHLPRALFEEAGDPVPPEADAEVEQLVEAGEPWDRILTRLRRRAVSRALDLSAPGKAGATRTERVRAAAARLGVSPRSVYDWSRDPAAGGDTPLDPARPSAS